MWTYISCAVGLFIYQSLDAIDGKQARRTNSSTPLGELFDHGCDSLSTGGFFFFHITHLFVFFSLISSPAFVGYALVWCYVEMSMMLHTFFSARSKNPKATS